MAKVLFDQNMTRRLKPLLAGHNVSTAEQMRWDLLKNGDLIRAAESAGFEILVTADTKMYTQQKHYDRLIALLVLMPNRWAVIRNNVEPILAALSRAQPGGHETLIMTEGGVPAAAKAGRSRR